MFDFRYHVVSLVAVFLALIVGIVIGVGLSGQGILEEGERDVLNDQIERLQAERDAANQRAEERLAGQAFVEEAYDAVMAGRLEGVSVAVLFLGSADPDLRGEITEAVEEDAGGTVVRFRSLSLPAGESALASTEDVADVGDLRDLGEALGEELVDGEEAPLWDALAGLLVLERETTSSEPADAVVVARFGDPQQGDSARFLRGLYAGISETVPAVWVDTEADPDAEPRRPSGMSAVQDVRSPLGKVGLAVLLAGGREGVYGTDEDADAVVPPIEPVPTGGAIDAGG